MARPKRPAPFVAGNPTDPPVNIGGTDFSAGNSASLSADGILTIDPASLDGGSGTGNGNDSGDTAPVRGRRGRKPGSVNARKTKDTVSVAGLASILLSGHTMLAAITRTQEFLIEPDEADAIAKASAEVLSYYDNLKISNQAVAWFGLISAVGAVYGPRVIAFRLRNASNPRPERPAPRASTAADASRPQTEIKTANGGQERHSEGPKIVDIPGFGPVTVGEKPH